MKKYIVVGEGIEYTSPEMSYDDAYKVWQDMSWKYVDSCDVGFRIVELTE